MYESRENYLETILVLSNRHGNVRSIDIARELNFSKPSVSRAVGLLKDDGYININEDGYITFTDKGRKVASGIYERHNILTEFLEKIAGVSPDIAEEDACRIEHYISEETFEGIKKFMRDN
ncbi:MAG: metal-dependent transcriptional regulator [Lachnospiraceae bacterium]